MIYIPFIETGLFCTGLIILNFLLMKSIIFQEFIQDPTIGTIALWFSNFYSMIVPIIIIGTFKVGLTFVGMTRKSRIIDSIVYLFLSTPSFMLFFILVSALTIAVYTFVSIRNFPNVIKSIALVLTSILGLVGVILLNSFMQEKTKSTIIANALPLQVIYPSAEESSQE